jgi:hypothetical protein
VSEFSWGLKSLVVFGVSAGVTWVALILEARRNELEGEGKKAFPEKLQVFFSKL